jgi:hypothetical protein
VAGAPQGHNLNDPLIFHNTGVGPFHTTTTPAGVVNHHALGYRYDAEAQVSLGGLKIPATYLQVLYGILGSGSVDDAPGDPWVQLTPAARDTLIGLAVNELAAQIGNSNARNQVQTAVAALTANIHGKVRAASS